jgi:hypothetical protein
VKDKKFTLIFVAIIGLNKIKLKNLLKKLLKLDLKMSSFGVQIVETKPFGDQKPGTSGLRKPVQTFMRSNYTENFVQSILNAVKDKEKLVIGGDGRYYSRECVQTIIAICAANQVSI